MPRLSSDRPGLSVRLEGRDDCGTRLLTCFRTGRVLYTIGYVTGNPAKRQFGVSFTGLPFARRDADPLFISPFKGFPQHWVLRLAWHRCLHRLQVHLLSLGKSNFESWRSSGYEGRRAKVPTRKQSVVQMRDESWRSRSCGMHMVVLSRRADSFRREERASES